MWRRWWWRYWWERQWARSARSYRLITLHAGTLWMVCGILVRAELGGENYGSAHPIQHSEPAAAQECHGDDISGDCADGHHADLYYGLAAGTECGFQGQRRSAECAGAAQGSDRGTFGGRGGSRFFTDYERAAG